MDWGTYFKRAWHVTGAVFIGLYGVYAAVVEGELMYGSISLLLIIFAADLARMEYQDIARGH